MGSLARVAGFVVVCLLATGCGPRVKLAPLEGRVTLDGKPLEMGDIMFQPRSGPAAQALINSDGTFRVGTFRPDDGAILGSAKVRVNCRQQINQPGEERAFGPSLIPEKYTMFDTSGITVDIQPGMPPLEISLTSK